MFVQTRSRKAFSNIVFAKHTEEVMCEVNYFYCPACHPDMLAVCCDGNRKHYRFKKSRGMLILHRH